MIPFIKSVLKNKKIEPIVLELYYWFSVVVFSIMPKYSTKHYYERITNKKIDLDHPKSYNEKIQWTKIYDHNPIYTKLADKYSVREYVAKIIGQDYLIPLLGVWDRFEDIDFSKLPNEFVLKCNHDSGSVVICKDKNKFDFKIAKNIITSSLKRNFYYGSGEWQYKNIERKIIAEKYMFDDKDNDLRDYKFLCFDGKPYICTVDTDRFGEHERSIYDMEWNRMPFSKGKVPQAQHNVVKPDNFCQMIEIVKKLSEGFRQVRIDLYDVNGHIYFGEITFTAASGITLFYPDEYDYIIGEKWKLSNE